MATSITEYTHLHKLMLCGASWTGNTVKLALVTSSYTFSAAHTVWADASTHEVASGGGYTTGGETLANKTAVVGKLDADDLVITALTKTFRGGVLYFSGTIDTLVNPLIGYLLFDTTPADTVIASTDFHIDWSASGIIVF